MLIEQDSQENGFGLERFLQRLGDYRGSDRPSLWRQLLRRPAARDHDVDVATGEGVGEGLAYLSESYNRVAHAASPMYVDVAIDCTAFRFPWTCVSCSGDPREAPLESFQRAARR